MADFSIVTEIESKNASVIMRAQCITAILTTVIKTKTANFVAKLLGEVLPVFDIETPIIG